MPSCQAFLPLKKPRNSNAKSGDTGNAMIAIPDAIVPMCVQQLCGLLSNGGNSNRWQTHTSSGLFAAMRRVRALLVVGPSAEVSMSNVCIRLHHAHEVHLVEYMVPSIGRYWKKLTKNQKV